MTRTLAVVADDFGIGPATSRGILDLAARGAVTATVLLTNSPYAADAVRQWRSAGQPLALGWHPCLTMDRPLLSTAEVPSLVDEAGRFFSLGRMLARLATGRIVLGQVRAEWRAQLGAFHDLVGQPPALVNAHHHLHVFPGIAPTLQALLATLPSRPYLRRVRVPAGLLLPGGGLPKQLLLSSVGRRAAQRADAAGWPGNRWLAGLGDAQAVADLRRLRSALAKVPSGAVELMCHPGFDDPTLAGRDPLRAERVAEWRALREPAFQTMLRDLGYHLQAAHSNAA